MKNNLKERLTHSIPVRIGLPALLTLILFVTAIFFVILPALEESFLARKREMIRELTESAWSILATFEAWEREGVMSRRKAQAQAIEEIRNIRYGPEKKDYFWINDMQPRMVMHPYRSDLEGQDISNFQDPHGKRLFMAFVRVVREQGAGYVDYMWQWKDDPERIVPKLSYVKGFEPWQWIIGTGIYIEDVHAEIGLIRRKLSTISAAILLVVSLLAFYIIRQTLLAERMRKRSRDFVALLDHTPDFICIKDTAYRFTAASQAYAALTGHAHWEDLSGKTDFDVLPPDQAKASHELEKAVIENGQVLEHHEAPFAGADGMSRWMLSDKRPFYDLEGRLLGLISISKDISDRKKMETALKQSEEFLQGIINNSTAIIIAKDLKGRYILVNERFCETFEMSPDAVIGKTTHEIFPKESADFFRQHDLAVLESRETVQEEEFIEHKGLTFLSIKFPVFGVDGDPIAVCGIATDITYLKKTEAELRQARQEMTKFRTRTQIVDPDSDIRLQMGLLNTLQQQLGKELINYDMLRQTTGEGDPRVKQSEQRIAATRERIREEREKFGISRATADGQDYASVISEFENLSVNLEFAEQKYTAALTNFDVAQADAQRKSRYLAAFVRPTLPESAEYPRRIVVLGLAVLFITIAWSIMTLIFYALRDRR